jgi:hypothetical protein
MHFFSGHSRFVGKEDSVYHETMEEWRYSSMCNIKLDTRWCRQGRGEHCTSSQNVAGWIPVDVVGIRNEYQEYSNRDKDGRCVGLTTLVPSCAECLEIGEPQPLGTLRACRRMLCLHLY